MFSDNSARRKNVALYEYRRLPYRTPKGVQNIGFSENYKHPTPPE